jgi:hypothetical protein
MQNLPLQERIIETGRVYLDIAHRGFVYFLIGIAGMSTVLYHFTREDDISTNFFISV